MPQIPVFTARVMPEATPQQGINPAAVAAPYQQIAAAGERAATMFGELAAATRKAQSAQELITARTAHTTRLAELRADLETNPGINPADIRARWDTGRAEISRDILGGMRDRSAQRDFRLAAAGVEAGELSGVVRLQATRTAEAGRANLSREIDGLSDLAAAARDPGERGRILGQIEGSIATAVQNRYLAADDAEKLRLRSLGRLDNAAVIGLIRTNPTGALQALGDPSRFSNLSPEQRERLATTATGALQARASMAAAGETRALRVQQLQADEAEKRFIDAQRAGDTPSTVRALEDLRRLGRPGAYAQASDSFYGRLEVPTTPQMGAWLETRLRDRGQPLTREELEGARASRRINDTTYRSGLERLSGREDARFREAEQFIERALEVPSATISDRDLQPWQREAKRQANAIVNDLVVQRRTNPDVDPLGFVRERLQSADAPQRIIEQQRATEQLRRLPATIQTREGLDTLSQQLSDYLAYRNLGFMERQGRATVEPPRVDGRQVTTEEIARWRSIQDQAGVQPARPAR